MLCQLFIYFIVSYNLQAAVWTYIPYIIRDIIAKQYSSGIVRIVVAQNGLPGAVKSQHQDDVQAYLHNMTCCYLRFNLHEYRLLVSHVSSLALCYGGKVYFIYCKLMKNSCLNCAVSRLRCVDFNLTVFVVISLFVYLQPNAIFNAWYLPQVLQKGISYLGLVTITAFLTIINLESCYVQYNQLNVKQKNTNEKYTMALNK